MRTTSRVELEQLVDWRAAFIAGLVAGLVFLIAEMLGQALIVGQSPWIYPHYTGALILGTDVLLDDISAISVIVGVLLHFVISVIYTLVLAAIIHEWELPVGVIVGLLFGLAVYAINHFTFTRFFPWFYPINNWLEIATHLLFGLTAGTVYELLEVERFIRVEKTEAAEE